MIIPVMAELNATVDVISRGADVISEVDTVATETSGDESTSNDSGYQVSVITPNSPKSPGAQNNNGNEEKGRKLPYGGRPLRFECNKCERKFHAPSHLKRHLLCHSSERPFQCEVCKKGFLQAWHLGRHMTTHTGNKPFTCPECPKSFGSRFEMKTHHNYIHQGIKEHKCEVCEKMFTLRSNLKVHMRKHTGEKPYQCSICLKKFGQRGHLQYHFKKHIVHDSADWALGNQQQQQQHKAGSLSREGQTTNNKEGNNTSKKEEGTHPQQQQDTMKKDEIEESKRMNSKQMARRLSTTPLSGRMFDHINPAELKPFVCVTCNCGFGEINSLRAHVRHSHPKKKILRGAYECAYCARPFFEIHDLQDHFEVMHTAKKLPVKSENESSLRPPALMLGTKRRHDEDTELPGHTQPRLRRTTSIIMFPPGVRSPSNLSTISDTSYDREKIFETPEYTTECSVPNCHCQPKISSPAQVFAFPPAPSASREGFRAYESREMLQSKYYFHLQQYQRLLDSHISLINTINSRDHRKLFTHEH